MKELTENQKHNYCKSALLLKRDIEFTFLQLGEMLHKIKQDRLFEAGWSSWDEYEMELKMSSGTISKLIRIYELFVLCHKFTPKQIAGAGGWSVVAELLPVVAETTPHARVEELLGICAEQTRTDLRRTVTEVKRGSPCSHAKTHRLILEICDDCGYKTRIIEDEKI